MKGIKVLLAVCICVCMVSFKNAEKKAASSGGDAQAKAVEEMVEAVADDRGYIVKVGDKAPDFDIEYLDGSVVKLSDLKGKLVMIQFTASWCGVCRKEMPYIERDIWQKYKDNPNFALVGITLKEDNKATTKFAGDIKVTYPLTLDVEGSKFELFTAPKAGVTRNIIVGKDGKIVMLTRLFKMEEFNSMVQFIDKYLTDNF